MVKICLIDLSWWNYYITRSMSSPWGEYRPKSAVNSTTEQDPAIYV